jgi:hypothetical protein
MKYATNCQFCKRPISPEIDDSYAALGDPFKILPMACCDPCHDMRVSKRDLERRVQFIARCIELAGAKLDATARAKFQDVLSILTQDYARLIARWHGMQGHAWSIECVEIILDKPQQWAAVMSGLWRFFRQTQEDRKAV